MITITFAFLHVYKGDKRNLHGDYISNSSLLSHSEDIPAGFFIFLDFGFLCYRKKNICFIHDCADSSDRLWWMLLPVNGSEMLQNRTYSTLLHSWNCIVVPKWGAKYNFIIALISSSKVCPSVCGLENKVSGCFSS